MSESQKHEAEVLTSTYQQAQEWWEGLSEMEKVIKSGSEGRLLNVNSFTMRQIIQIWEAENKSEEKPVIHVDEPMDQSLFDGPTVAALKMENKLMREALHKISTYKNELPDQYLKGTLISVMSIADIALHQLGTDTKKSD